MDAAYEWACTQVGVAVHPRLFQNCAEYSQHAGMWDENNVFLSLGGAFSSVRGRDRPIQDADVAAVCLLLQSLAKSAAALPMVHLDLTGEAVTCEGARTIAAVLQVDCGLRAVSLRQTRVSDKGIAALGSVLGGSKLAELDLGECAIHNSGIRYFVRGLQQLGPSVTFTTLLLDGNPFGDDAIVDLISLIEGIHRPPALTSLSVRPKPPGALSVEVDAALRVLCDLCRIDLREPSNHDSSASWGTAAVYTPSEASNSLRCSTDMVPILANASGGPLQAHSMRPNHPEALARSLQSHLVHQSNGMALNSSGHEMAQALRQPRVQTPLPNVSQQLPMQQTMHQPQFQPPSLTAQQQSPMQQAKPPPPSTSTVAAQMHQLPRTSQPSLPQHSQEQALQQMQAPSAQQLPPASYASSPQQQMTMTVPEPMQSPALQTPQASLPHPSTFELSSGASPHALVTPASRSSRHLAEWMAGTERELRELKWLFGASVARVDGQHSVLMQELDKLRNQIDVWAGEGNGDGTGGFALGGTVADETRLETLEARFDALEKLVGREQTECAQMWQLVETAIGTNSATIDNSRVHSGTSAVVTASTPTAPQACASSMA